MKTGVAYILDYTLDLWLSIAGIISVVSFLALHQLFCFDISGLLLVQYDRIVNHQFLLF